ncbi:MAG: universal stress protein [Rhodospirillum sp.]|nr:universal stress protein [Rhodospirillum sp.]MCF8491605.1 universal stress protein [Rhodospirillum sp.]MCF8499514.1 universal stress protein [Rhodospirillum sp.]
MLVRSNASDERRTRDGYSQGDQRTFLVVVDDSTELRAAVRFAARRAQNTGGRVALMYAIAPAEFDHWMFVGNLIREEAREDAEHKLNRHASIIRTLCGQLPVLYVREGECRQELFKLIEEEQGISILVLGAADNADDPGPLVRDLTGRYAGRLRVPVTIVPGNLSDEEIDTLA